jgi:hypothetical protein
MKKALFLLLLVNCFSGQSQSIEQKDGFLNVAGHQIIRPTINNLLSIITSQTNESRIFFNGIGYRYDLYEGSDMYSMLIENSGTQMMLRPVNGNFLYAWSDWKSSGITTLDVLVNDIRSDFLKINDEGNSVYLLLMLSGDRWQVTIKRDFKTGYESAQFSYLGRDKY